MQFSVFSCFQYVSKERNRLGASHLKFLEVCESTSPAPVDKQHDECQERRDQRRLSQKRHGKHLLLQFHYASAEKKIHQSRLAT